MTNKIMVSLTVLLFAFPSFCAIKPGDPAAEISLQALIPDQPAANASLKSLKGKAVVIEFWATWCAPCVDAIAHINELTKQFEGKPIQFLSITSEDRGVVEKFLKSRPISGWIGFDAGNKLLKMYSSEIAIPQTVLIDPDGNLAALTFPSVLKAEHLSDLIARKKLNLPSLNLMDMTVKRESLETGPPPLLDIIVRPGTAGKSAMSMGSGKYSWLGMPLKDIFARIFEIDAAFVEGDAVSDTTLYDVSALGPGSESAELRKILQDLIAIAFHVRTKRETRETEGYVITAPNGKPGELREAAGMSSYYQNTKGTLKFTGATLDTIAGAVRSALKKPAANKTGIQGRFDIVLSYDAARPESLIDEMRKIGFGVEPARLSTEFLMVTKK